MPVDLHLHSSYSDGSDSPEQIVRAAVDAGLSAIALTDHDNLNGIAEAREAAAAVGIDLIPGTELSVEWDGAAMHLLVYFLEPGTGPLQDRLEFVQSGRTDRNREMVDRLQTLGIDIAMSEVEAEAGGTGVGRPHFAAVLVAKGYVDTISEAFDRLLATGRPGYVPRVRLGCHEAIELALASGAVPAVAHPHTLGVGRDEFAAAFAGLADAGLAGLEAHYHEYAPELRTHLAALADDLGLIATGGSDYHGSYKPGLSVGVGQGDLVVPDSVVEALYERRNAIRAT